MNLTWIKSIEVIEIHLKNDGSNENFFKNRRAESAMNLTWIKSIEVIEIHLKNDGSNEHLPNTQDQATPFTDATQLCLISIFQVSH
ncbi:hypothetical protein HNY73_012529 [Argiope bruennichi]|uniref:Uncharacterized protein n=1 Tax=Argiope bruennichi TaxID=94029 RepID=A0A8T0EZP0_ARGBR|nr:hypothetical protein HNY73_012529 [Argiope bruennichi]